jgi:hypothetical protein
MRDFDRRLAKLEQVEDRRETHYFVEHNHDGCADPYYSGLGQPLNVASREAAEALFPDLRIKWVIIHHVDMLQHPDTNLEGISHD